MVDQPKDVNETTIFLHYYFQVDGQYKVRSDLSIDVAGVVTQKTTAAHIPLKFHPSGSFSFRSLWKGLRDLSCLPDNSFGLVSISYYTDLALLRCLNARSINLEASSIQVYDKCMLAQGIMEKYQGQGRAAAVACAAELAAAGLKGNARW